jgi:hypothetical protein
MPQALPANPNRDWLKKTAKQRLVQLRTSQPDAELRQAQFAVARGRDDMAELIREIGGVR